MVPLLAFLLLIAYSSVGAMSMINQIDELVQCELESGKSFSEPVEIFLLLKALVCGTLWPIYYGVRALYSIPERLMLGPGETP